MVEFAALRGGIGSFREDKLWQYLAQHSSLRVQEAEFRLPWQPEATETVWDDEEDDEEEEG